MLRFLLGLQENNISKFSVEPLSEARTKRLFSGIKILEDSIWLLSDFRNGQKLVQSSN